MMTFEVWTTCHSFDFYIFPFARELLQARLRFQRPPTDPAGLRHIADRNPDLVTDPPPSPPASLAAVIWSLIW